MAAEWRLSVDLVAVKYRPGVGRHACQFMSTDTRPSLGRHIGRVSVDISAECRSPYRPIVLTGTRSTDALSTHDPSKLYFYKRHVPGCQGDTHDNLHQKIPDPGITVKLTIT